tara:strand:- start:293 stop:871 length:579 start_codon:yes stop_codon:yes gene_type:complete
MPGYKSNAKKIIGKLSKKFNRLSKTETDKIARTAAFTLQANIANRVFQDGIATNGTGIGSYSTKDILIGAKSFITKEGANKIFGSKPKRKKQKWVTKNGKHLVVLPGGYAKLRQLQGRQSSKVDLHLSGKLLNEWKIAGRKNQYILGFESDYGGTISKAMEQKYKKRIWNSSAKERKEIVSIFEGGIKLVFR